MELPSPFLWGDPSELRRRLGPFAAEVDVESYVLRFEFSSFDDWRSRFESSNPPLMAMRQILPAPTYEGLARDAWALAEELNAGSPGLIVESAYLSVLASPAKRWRSGGGTG